MADKIVQIKQKNGEDNDNIIPQRAQTSDYPTGFTTRRGDEIEWGVQTGTLISCWDVEATDSLGSLAFRKDCPENGKVSMLIDGTVYVNEGLDEVVSIGPYEMVEKKTLLYSNNDGLSISDLEAGASSGGINIPLFSEINFGDSIIIETDNNQCSVVKIDDFNNGSAFSVNFSGFVHYYNDIYYIYGGVITFTFSVYDNHTIHISHDLGTTDVNKMYALTWNTSSLDVKYDAGFLTRPNIKIKKIYKLGFIERS